MIKQRLYRKLKNQKETILNIHNLKRSVGKLENSLKHLKMNKLGNPSKKRKSQMRRKRNLKNKSKLRKYRMRKRHYRKLHGAKKKEFELIHGVNKMIQMTQQNRRTMFNNWKKFYSKRGVPMSLI